MYSEYSMAVLLSTYNGENYIDDQIESVLKQKDIDGVFLLIRDDGSTDNTVEHILKWIKKYDNIELINGNNIGLVASYFELLRVAFDRQYEYFSFCDQDDYWLPEKLSVAKKALDKVNKPALYCSCSTIVDGNLNIQKYETQHKRRRISFYNTAIQNICPGHNQVLNRKLAELILEYTNLNESIYSQDLWIANVAAVTGEIIFDNKSHTLYRNHFDNQLGYGANIFSKVKNRIIRIRKKEGKKFLFQLTCFLNNYNKFLSEKELSDAKMLSDISDNFFKRVYTLYKTNFYRQKKTETFAFYVLYAFGMYN